LAKDTIVDSLFFPKAIFAAARIEREQLNDTVHSDSLFKLLIARFPGTDYSRRAQEELRVSAITKTRKEQSEEAFREAEKIYFFDNDPKAAVQAYYNVYKKYPDLAIGPKSLYAAAWITDNELQKKKIAKSLYEKICERYPQSGYCKNEAQPRIKVVLDTLEALRKANKDGGASILDPKPADSAKQAAGRQGASDSAKSVAAPIPKLDSASGTGKKIVPPPVDSMHKSAVDSTNTGARPTPAPAPLQRADSPAVQRGTQGPNASPQPMPVLVDTGAMRAGKEKYRQADTAAKR